MATRVKQEQPQDGFETTLQAIDKYAAAVRSTSAGKRCAIRKALAKKTIPEWARVIDANLKGKSTGHFDRYQRALIGLQQALTTHAVMDDTETIVNGERVTVNYARDANVRLIEELARSEEINKKTKEAAEFERVKKLLREHKKSYFRSPKDEDVIINRFFTDRPNDKFYILIKYTINVCIGMDRYASIKYECVDLIRSEGGSLTRSGKHLEDISDIPSSVNGYTYNASCYENHEVGPHVLRCDWAKLPNVHIIRTDMYAAWVLMTE